MDAFSSGFVVGALVVLVLGAATVGVTVWAALQDTPDTLDEFDCP